MIKKFINKILDIHPNAMSFQNSMDLTELPVVTFYQDKKKINFLLDTGATCCTIDEAYLKELKYTPLDVTTTQYGIEGNKVTLNTCNIGITYKEEGYHCPCIIRDLSSMTDSIKQESGVTIHGIIGSNFFNSFDDVLDFEKYIAYSKKE